MDHLLSSQGIDDDQRYFSSLSVNPQGQLCLTLNRPLVIAMTIDEVINQGTAYGCRNVSSVAETSLIPSTTEKQQILLVHQFSSSLRESVDLQGIAVTQTDQVNCKMKEATLVVDTMPLNKLDLNEGRSLLVLGLLLRLLQAQGHSVTYCANLTQVCVILFTTYIPHLYPFLSLHELKNKIALSLRLCSSIFSCLC